MTQHLNMAAPTKPESYRPDDKQPPSGASLRYPYDRPDDRGSRGRVERNRTERNPRDRDWERDRDRGREYRDREHRRGWDRNDGAWDGRQERDRDRRHVHDWPSRDYDRRRDSRMERSRWDSPPRSRPTRSPPRRKGMLYFGRLPMSTNSLPEYGYSDPSGSSTRRSVSPRGQQRHSYNHRRSASRSPPRNRTPRCLSPRHPKFGKNSIPNSPHSPVRHIQELSDKTQEHDTKQHPRRPSPNSPDDGVWP